MKSVMVVFVGVILFSNVIKGQNPVKAIKVQRIEVFEQDYKVLYHKMLATLYDPPDSVYFERKRYEVFDSTLIVSKNALTGNICLGHGFYNDNISEYFTHPYFFGISAGYLLRKVLFGFDGFILYKNHIMINGKDIEYNCLRLGFGYDMPLGMPKHSQYYYGSMFYITIGFSGISREFEKIYKYKGSRLD